MPRNQQNRQVGSWALYDWANSAFATTVMAGFFPIFFKEYWSQGVDVTMSSFRLGVVTSTGSVVIAALAPVLGAIADGSGLRKRFLLCFAAVGIVMTAALYGVGAGDWLVAAIIYGVAVIGFSASIIFSDSLLPVVARPGREDFVSGLGFSVGYLGGGLLFALNVFMYLSPGSFGLSSGAQAVRVSFLSVAVWWALFSIPLGLFVKEPPRHAGERKRSAVATGFTELRATFRDLRQYRTVFLFLIAYWLYIDGVQTIVRMSVDYGLALGFSSNSLIVALLITQFVGFPAALAFGKLGERIGPKKGILAGIAVYLAVAAWGYRMQDVREFYVLAVAVGLVQGGVQSLSRSLYLRLIPKEKSAQFFGFYNMLGRFAAIIGPVLMGWVSLATGNPRMSMIVIMVPFVAGAVVLHRVKLDQPRQKQ